MSDEVYTLGVWLVTEGRERDFVAAWQELGRHFADLPDPPGEGTLVQSLEEPQRFSSFGPWRTLDAVEAMRRHPGTPAAIARLTALCEEARPGTFRVVATG